MSKNSQKKSTATIESSVEAWESRQLGCDEQYVVVADVDESAIDDALELQMISIRLPKGLIEDLKLIAQEHGLGYQPLIRNQLTRFVDCELKNLARNFIESKIEKERHQKDPKEVRHCA